MSTEQQHGQHAGELPRHDDVAFEPRDLNPMVIVRYLIYLAITVVVSLAICVWVYDFTSKLAADGDAPLPPVREGKAPSLPPEPRLQGVTGHDTDAQEDLRRMIKQDAEANARLGWVDEKAGIAQIPVEDAMKIIAQKGLPAVSAPPAEKKQ